MAERGGEVAELVNGTHIELGGVNISERIGRKIADESGTPMDVLETAFGVVAQAKRRDNGGISRSRPPARRSREGCRRGGRVQVRTG